MATDWQGAVAEGQGKGFVVNTSRLPEFKGRLDLLLQQKINARMQMPPLPPIMHVL